MLGCSFSEPSLLGTQLSSSWFLQSRSWNEDEDPGRQSASQSTYLLSTLRHPLLPISQSPLRLGFSSHFAHKEMEGQRVWVATPGSHTTFVIWRQDEQGGLCEPCPSFQAGHTPPLELAGVLLPGEEGRPQGHLWTCVLLLWTGRILGSRLLDSAGMQK